MKLNKVVSKFGGSSVKDAAAFKKVAAIIQETKPALVVLSATYNTTNELEQLAMLKSPEREFLSAELHEKHQFMADELGIGENCRLYIDELIKEANDLCLEINAQSMDQLYSIGERLSSRMLYEYLCSMGLDVELIDARSIIKTDENFSAANPLIADIANHAKPYKKYFGKKLLVTQGFIGESFDKKTTTLGREGSDYTAALLGEAFQAEAVNIWTDVAGIATVDPRLYSGAHFLDHLSYEQAEAMAMNGAKVLFPRTLSPLKRVSIPLYVKSTFDPSKQGTKISMKPFEHSVAIGMAYQNNLLTIVTVNPEKVEEIIGVKLHGKSENCVQVEVDKSFIASLHKILFDY